MSNKSEREKRIIQYRQLIEKIKLESDESKKTELRKKASEVHNMILKAEFDDDNIKRFSI